MATPCVKMQRTWGRRGELLNSCSLCSGFDGSGEGAARLGANVACNRELSDMCWGWTGGKAPLACSSHGHAVLWQEIHKIPCHVVQFLCRWVQDWHSWKNSMENQHWNIMKRCCSEPVSITTWAKLGKIHIKSHLFPALRKLIAFQSSLWSWTLLPFLPREAAWYKAVVPSTAAGLRASFQLLGRC